MTIIQRLERLLTETERALLALANEAGTARDYDQALSLIELARRIQQLTEEYARGPSSGPEALADPNDRRRDVHLTVGRRIPERSRNRLGQYPTFVREGENLIKIGWSKSERAEYEHKSPKRVVTALCQTLTGAKGKRIKMGKVLPLKDTPNGSAFSDYQAYVCLSWLKSVGLVTQHGRQGYSLPKGTELAKAVESQWANLPTR